ncbi:MAG: hypothetical protein mread185_000571 [Mycoplasmataceae bacterium]|nr:MAG: hypothetical protein mread185_000571 [Mycoplasmataceae bacterium]
MVEQKNLVSALSVTNYLLSLDKRREYFSKSRLLVVDKEENYHSRPIIGNFRLNKVLQMVQSLHYSCYGQPLFRDVIKAYEHGGVVPFIFKNFKTLYWENNNNSFSSLDEKQKEFISKVFYYLKENYNDWELRELAHDDLAWENARKSKLEGKSDAFVYDSEVLEYYRVLSGSLLEAMNIKC